MITLSGYTFSGPYYHTKKFTEDFGCVYLLINSQNQVVDVGETSSINSRIINHDRKSCWYAHGCGDFSLYIHKSNDQNYRLLIERIIRELYSPLCGNR